MSDKKQPNILVIWGDDIGITNLSCYGFGVMGYQTPNIDRMAKEGMLFTDSYGEQSCTAGRSSFITGQSVFRTGLSKVGIPGADQGLSAEDPTIATLLKEQGYATAQFGKNHFGDLNKYIPTVHGFDQFFGVFYHLNAYEDPEHPDWPPADKFPDFLDRYGPRNVIHAWATDEDDETVQPRWGKIGKQRFDDTGPLNIERIKSFDDECLDASLDFIERQAEADKPFFVWHNTTRMHAYTPDQGRDPRPGRALAVSLPRRDDRARPAHRQAARQAGRVGHRRQHHRGLLERQRSAPQHAAGRRDDPLPQ
jgi:arylsulfatase